MLKKRVKKGGRGRQEAAKKAHAPSPAGGTITDELRSQLIANNSNAYADQAGEEGEESNVLIVGAKKKKEKVKITSNRNLKSKFFPFAVIFILIQLISPPSGRVQWIASLIIIRI